LRKLLTPGEKGGKKKRGAGVTMNTERGRPERKSEGGRSGRVCGEH